MQKRRIIIGDYDTAAHGWTLTAWRLSDAKQKTNYVNKVNGDGSWDLSTVATDGIPIYEDRELTATLECSEGTRLDREAVINHMINSLDGYQWKIQLPDDDKHYIFGRVHVVREYNNLAHGSVSLTATVEPWKYANAEKSVTVTASAEAKAVQLTNVGRRPVVPVLRVSGTDASMTLVFGSSTIAMSAGTRQWPEILLTSGAHTLTYIGTGTLTITYREAVLE